ncbi:MAG: hypothetical protein EU532_10890 [Promethearchaeota archaeon]|nr:MAG: hypothetical protein EU532_10890 [Candidatus Lokiarchaeota archaeon]
MAETFSEGKPPRKPYEYGNLVICKEDFYDYKNFLVNTPETYNENLTYRLFKEFGVDDTFIEFHNQSSNRLRELIKKGREKMAFSEFIQSFPSCLPNRTYLRNLFKSFKKF